MMRTLKFSFGFLVLAFLPFDVVAQGFQSSPEEIVKRGGELFNRTCAQSYCHGANGVAGGAPKLAGRGFEGGYIERVVTYGVSGTPMPAWGQTLPGGDLAAVIAYVKSLNGISKAESPAPTPTLSGEAKHGRDLFYDASAELGRCSNCHRINGRGLSIAPIKTIPNDPASLRNLATPSVATASLRGEKFPALLDSQTRETIKLYDLTSVRPVLLTLSPSEVKLTQGSEWRHSSVFERKYSNADGKNYSDDDLNAILAFMHAVLQP
jgi:mono/diheme cytochrome c family protein